MWRNWWILGIAASLTGCGVSMLPMPGALDRSVVGNGTDLANEEEVAAWFQGPEPIRYCVHLSPDFGVSAAMAHLAIHHAFGTWQRYIEKKQLNDAAMHPGRQRQPTDPTLEMQSKVLRHCDGTQELTFWLGTEDETVREQRKRYRKPIAFAERTSDEGRGRGFIWVAAQGTFADGSPQWRWDGSELGAILVHELGHVAGNGHVDGTVMDPRLFRLVNFYSNARGLDRYLSYQNIQWIDLWGFTREERHRELLLCEGCELAHPGTYLVTADDMEAVFLAFTGRYLPKESFVSVVLESKPKGAEGLRFHLNAHRTNYSTVSRYRASFEVPKLTRTATFRNDGVVFRQVFRRPGATTDTVLESRSEGLVFTGDVRTHLGVKRTVTLKRNVHGETLNLVWVDDSGETRTLFELGAVLKKHGIDP